MKKATCFLVLLLEAGSLMAQNPGWTAINSGLTQDGVWALATSGSNLFAGTFGNGVFLSTDDGTSWKAVNNGLTNMYIYAMAVKGSNIFAGSCNGGGVFRSLNNGNSWQPANTGLTNHSIYSFAVSAGKLFLGTNGGGVFLSTDDGGSWTAVNSGLSNKLVWALAASGTKLFAGTQGGGVFVSTNEGASWVAANAGLDNITYVYSVTTKGGDVYLGTSNGLFVSTNGGASWVARRTGLPEVVIYALATDGMSVFAGTGSARGVFVSTDNGARWSAFNAGMTAYNAVWSLASNDKYLFAGTYERGAAYRRPLADFVCLSSPAYGTSAWVAPITFKWRTNVQALAYSFQVSTNANFTNVIISQSTVDTSETVSGLQPSTVYYWRVRAENTTWASEWGTGMFTTKLTSAPQLSSPISGAKLTSVSPTLVWTTVVSTATYTIQLSTRPTFDVVLFSRDTSATSVTLPPLEGSTVYYWRVRAQTNADTTGWSSINSFITAPSPPMSIRPIYPDSAKLDAYQNDWILWQPDTAATSYRIQISQSPLFTSIFDSSTVSVAGYRNRSKSFSSGATYFWRVRGCNLGGEGPFSSVWLFRVGSSVRMPLTSYSSSILDYGRVKVSQSKDCMLTVSNSGTDTLQIQDISSSKGIFAARPRSRTLALGQSFVDTISYTPTAIGPHSGEIIVRSNSATRSDTIVVSGFGFGEAIASINCSDITLGRVKIGQFRDTMIVVSNTGNDTLKISNVYSSDAVFTVRATNCVVPPSESFVDTIRYAPTKIGVMTASIIVVSNSPSTPDTVKISGFGFGEAAVVLSAPVISFGSIKVKQYRDTILTVSNSGNDTLKVLGVYSSCGAYTARPTSGSILPGQSLKDTIRFSPDTYGDLKAVITVLSNATPSRDTIHVFGVGVAGALKFNVTRFDLGLVLVGKSRDTTLIISNQGNDTLRIASISSKSPEIVCLPQSLIIPPGVSSTDTVKFIPRSLGPLSTTILFKGDGITSTDTVWLTGSGVTATTGIAGIALPTKFRIAQNYPNPFNPSTTFRFDLPIAATVSLRVFNTLGQVVATLASGRRDAGYHEVVWSANVASGIYFYRLTAGEFVETKKMMLLK